MARVHEGLEASSGLTLDRRKFVAGVTGALATGSLVACRSGEASESTEIDTSDDTAHSAEQQDTVAQNNLASNSNPDLYADREHQNPNRFSEMTEYELRDYFSLSSETAPEDYPEAFTELFGAALNLGCTEEEMGPWLFTEKNTDVQRDAEDIILGRLDDKYTYPVFRSLFRDMSREEAESNPTYDLFRQARRDVLRRFLRHARKSGNLNELAAVEMTGHDEPRVNRDGSFGVRIDMRITNDVGDDDPTKDYYEVEGTISAGASEYSNGKLSTLLVAYEPYNEVFEELSAINNNSQQQA